MADKNDTLEIGMLVFPRVTHLDVTGPHELMARIPNSRTRLLWHSLDPVASDTGLRILPDTTFDACGPLDLLLVPGGPGSDELLNDEQALAFLAQQGAQARWVTSVCTGSLVLGAAGLLKGYRAGCHWASRHLLEAFGAIPDSARVVVDRNRITGGGITAGIDFGLQVVAEVRGTEVAQGLQLMLEYNPHPPFDAGSPDTAPAALVERTRARIAPLLESRSRKVAQAAARLG